LKKDDRKPLIGCILAVLGVMLASLICCVLIPLGLIGAAIFLYRYGTVLKLIGAVLAIIGVAYIINHFRLKRCVCEETAEDRKAPR